MGMAAKLQNLSKRNNSAGASKAKVLIRQNVLDAIGADKAHVFDAFAGDGHMYRTVWSKAAHCVGCDTEFYLDDRLAFKADNRRVLRAIDLAVFNVFDLNAYGSPWEQAYIIAMRRTLAAGETLGLVLTEGQGLKMKMGGMSAALSRLAGVKMRAPGMGRAQGDLIDRAIRRLGVMMGGRVTKRWEAVGKSGSTMHYIGLVLTGE
jgi:hypothetical protein